MFTSRVFSRSHQPRLRATTARGRRSRARCRRGAYTVEFAIVAPILFLFVFGIIEFGRLLMVQHALNGAARIACRNASLATTINASGVDVAARNAMAAILPSAYDTSK